MSRRSKYILRKRGKIDRLQIFLGADVLKVAWESGYCNFYGSARYCAFEDQFSWGIDRNKVVPRVK